jgi:hypothetical protein
MKLLKYLIILIAASVVSSGQPPDRFPPLMATPAEARMLLMNNGVPVVAGSYCDGKTGYVACEDFEGAVDCSSDETATNCRNTWTNSSYTTIPNFAYTAGKLDGTKSLYINEATNGDTALSYLTVAAQSNIYLFARWKAESITGFGADGDLVHLIGFGPECFLDAYRNAGTVYWSLYVDNDASRTNAATSPAQGQEYYIWMEYNASQANGCRAYISTDGTKPAVTINGGTTSSWTISEVSFRVRDWGPTVDQVTVDDILIDDAVIGNQ